ncbi:hypothetical protein PR202_ga28290 [Eleusine coracana subsp. coracana]|uniref:F-box domain-containing protein n=1 Tax=Eleusine coracana subsp. coracana TaxID=191504 RepID=A0AAV5DGZ9_ELECO|nr:hypothetical protein PR202_ga28290 [Eleusine coracana subsp. coracana]
MEMSGDEVAVKRTDLSSSVADAGEDCLRTLPDDILLLILRRIGSLAAGQTSVLSRRWRRVWALLPELDFLSFTPLDPTASATPSTLMAGALRFLRIATRDASPESVASWLPVSS